MENFSENKNLSRMISMWRFHKQFNELSIVAIRILKATSTLVTNLNTASNFCCALFSKLLFNFYLSFRAISKIITVIHFNISTQAFYLKPLSNYSLCHSTNLPTFHISPPDFCSLAVENKATKCFSRFAPLIWSFLLTTTARPMHRPKLINNISR